MNGKIAGVALRTSAAVCGLVLLALPAFAGGAEDFQVLGISPQDGRAVVRTPEGEKKVIKAGDVLESSPPTAPGGRTESKQLPADSGRRKQREDKHTLTVVEIAEGRVVFEEKRGEATETVIIRPDGGKRRIERIRRTGEKRPGLLAPQAGREGPAKDGKKKRSGSR